MCCFNFCVWLPLTLLCSMLSLFVSFLSHKGEWGGRIHTTQMNEMNNCCLQTWTCVIVYHYFYCIALLYLYDTFVSMCAMFVCHPRLSSFVHIKSRRSIISFTVVNKVQCNSCTQQQQQQQTAAIYCTAAAAAMMTVIACVNCAIYRRFHNVLLLLLLLQWPSNMIFCLFVVHFTVEIK